MRLPTPPSRWRRLSSPEILEVRAAPGGGLLEILFGGALLRTFTDWRWEWDHIASTGVVDELTYVAKRSDALSALAAVHDDPGALSSVLDDVRSLLAVSAAKSDRVDDYLEIAKARIEGLSKGLAQGAVDTLASREFLSDLWWTQELFMSVAVWRSRGSGGDVLTDDPPPNTPPIAEDDWHDIYHTYGQAAQLSVDASAGVLWNDIDPDSGPNPLSVVPASGSTAQSGSYYIESAGGFGYISAPGYVGQDWFDYTLTDGAATDEGRVRIAIGNHPPTVNPSGYPDGPFWAVYMTELVVPAPGVRADDYDEDGDPFTVSVVAQPQHGTVSLDANDGSFHYTPQDGYLGNDSFTYRAYDGYEYSSEATVSIVVTRPEADIDTDSDNNGIIDMTPEEDQDEMIDPGKIVRWNVDDDNGNGTLDRDDAYPFLNGQGQPVYDDDLVPALLDLVNSTGDLTGFTLELGTGPNTRLFAFMDREPLPLTTYTIGMDPYPPAIYVEGYDLGQSAVTWTVKNPSGVVVASDSLKFSVVQVNLIGYRPQTEGPDYGAPFPKTPVPNSQEESPGVGIRRNGDNDNGVPPINNELPDLDPGDTAIENENDLIEAYVGMWPCPSPGVKYYLQRSNQNINVWREMNKNDGMLVSNNPNNWLHMTSVGNLWVEWATMEPAQTRASLELSAWDGVHNNKTNVVDTLSFYPFASVVIAFGGNNAVPLDPNAGPFQMAQNLYENGYDVHAYNEGIVDEADARPYHEIERAVEMRGVTEVAIFGHSYGGGATRYLATQLVNDPLQGTWALVFTGYIDAVRHDSAGVSEERRPPGSAYHVNYYQTHGGVDGEPTEGNPEITVNVDVTNPPWPGAQPLYHTTIDNDPEVQRRILEGYHGNLPNNINHDGLRDRTWRWPRGA